MKALIKTTRRISAKEKKEVQELLDVEFVIQKTTKKIVPSWNPYFKVIEVDWAWFKSLFKKRKADIYCFCTTRDDLRDANITKYIGQYKLDKDGVHDFWMGVPSRLDKRATANGFKTNFAWLFIHEYLHGKELLRGVMDRTHAMQDQGRLKELLHDEPVTEVEEEQKVKLMKLIAVLKKLLALLLGLKYTTPLPQYWGKVTQSYLYPNPQWYPKTGVHIGTDFAAPLNTPILAPMDGVITRSGYTKTMGNWVEFKFEDKYMVCLHLREAPQKGVRKKGEPVGFVGDTGFITGVHAHIECWTVPRNLSLLNSKADVKKYTMDIMKVIG